MQEISLSFADRNYWFQEARVAVKIYTNKQILLAIVIGGPVGGLWALTRDVAAVGRPSALAIALLLIGWTFAVMFLLGLPYFSPVVAFGALPLFIGAGVYGAFHMIVPQKPGGKGPRTLLRRETDDALRIAGLALAVTLLFEFFWLQF
ncbi:MAG: hypothetical protein CTY15_13665 [Methylocystis sp.]|nr:MAG: hypothetical protein CTY15_13665 [Methylocystis sp.]